MINAAWIILIVGIWFIFSYRFYGRFIEKRIKINDKHETPAIKYRDNIDFMPASKPFLIGHHFASIAGAGPIIGPILAISYFGWLPTMIWVGIGAVFIGAMHDFTSLIASVRNKAEGIPSIAKKSLSSRSGILAGVMILVTLILIITVFSVSAAESIVNKTDLIIPLITITTVALVLGFGVERFKWNYKLSTAVAIILIFLSVWIGLVYPIDLSSVDETLLRNILVTIILIYAGIASVIPVWMLLRPRDYLSAIQMSVILFLGVLGILIVRPVINAPAYISNPVFPLWPILFITVACGAISGFHGLVASGTTSKQIMKESHGKPIGYGAMLMEATLATLVILVSIAGLKWGVGEITFQTELSKSWIVLFSSGYGNIVGGIGIPLITVTVASLLGAFMVNQFILTSVDTSTRLSRFIISESLIPKLKNKAIITLLILIPAWLIAVTNSYETLWRLFGTSNQLIASITMMAVAAFFLSKGIKKVKFIVIPALLVLVTTMYALLYLTFYPEGYIATGNWVLAVTSLVMFALGLLVSWDGFKYLRKRTKAKKRR